MASNLKIRVLIIDDHLISILGTKALLKGSQTIEVVDFATSKEEALKILEKVHVDVILLDLFMPDINGIEFLQELKSMNSNLKIIILTISDDKQRIISAINGDADGYLLKDISHESLFLAIKKAYQGKPAFDSRVFEILYSDFKNYIQNHYTIEKNNEEMTLEDMLDILTPREVEVLKLIAQNKSTNEISEAINISRHTISSYRKNIYSKLHINKLLELKKVASKLFGTGKKARHN